MTLAVTYPDIAAAATRLHGVVHRTPVFTSSTADVQCGAQLFFKCENFQRMGAFKMRGGFNALAKFSPAQKQAGAIAFSSGNHAQAVALAAKLLNMPALILMPQDAPALKIAATRGYGAQVVLFDRYTQDREALAVQLANERGMTLIPPYNHVDVIAGQGTAAQELFEEVGALDVLLVCMGGGGLTAGCAVAAQQLSPQCQVYGVEPEAGDDFAQSLRAGRIVKIDVPRTIADGAQTQSPGDLTFAIVQALGAGVLTVSDAQLVETMHFFAQRMKMVVEPTGCLAAAAALQGGHLAYSRSGAQGTLDIRGKRVGIIVSGGNIDPQRYAEFLTA